MKWRSPGLYLSLRVECYTCNFLGFRFIIFLLGNLVFAVL